MEKILKDGIENHILNEHENTCKICRTEFNCKDWIGHEHSGDCDTCDKVCKSIMEGDRIFLIFKE